MNLRVLKIRKRLKLSQEEFGSRIGVTKSAISKIEKGENVLTDKNIKIICSVYNVNEEWLRNGEGVMFKTEGTLLELLGQKMDELDELDKKIITEYIKLNSNHREIIKGFIKNIIA